MVARDFLSVLLAATAGLGCRQSEVPSSIPDPVSGPPVAADARTEIEREPEVAVEFAPLRDPQHRRLEIRASGRVREWTWAASRIVRVRTGTLPAATAASIHERIGELARSPVETHDPVEDDRIVAYRPGAEPRAWFRSRAPPALLAVESELARVEFGPDQPLEAAYLRFESVSDARRQLLVRKGVRPISATVLDRAELEVVSRAADGTDVFAPAGSVPNLLRAVDSNGTVFVLVGDDRWWQADVWPAAR